MYYIGYRCASCGSIIKMVAVGQTYTGDEMKSFINSSINNATWDAIFTNKIHTRFGYKVELKNIRKCPDCDRKITTLTNYKALFTKQINERNDIIDKIKIILIEDLELMKTRWSMFLPRCEEVYLHRFCEWSNLFCSLDKGGEAINTAVKPYCNAAFNSLNETYLSIPDDLGLLDILSYCVVYHFANNGAAFKKSGINPSIKTALSMWNDGVNMIKELYYGYGGEGM